MGKEEYGRQWIKQGRTIVGAGEKWKRKKEVGSVSTPVEVPSNFSAVVVLMSGAFNQSCIVEREREREREGEVYLPCQNTTNTYTS